jgi:hypothetical protein
MENCPEKACNIRSLNHRQNPYNQAKDLIIVEGKTVYQEEYYSIYSITCGKCGQKFSVKEDPGYHTPTYSYPTEA